MPTTGEIAVTCSNNYPVDMEMYFSGMCYDLVRNKGLYYYIIDVAL